MAANSAAMITRPRHNSEECHDTRNVDSGIHSLACRYYIDRHRQWFDRRWRNVRFAQVARYQRTFLFTTVLTSVTGFLFPIHGFTPALGVGIVSCVILLVALFAYYGRRLIGAWRWIYVVTAIAALYLNVFVLVVQSFVKVAALNALAPTQSEPPFMIAQLAVLAIFIVIGLIAAVTFRPATYKMIP
jgi:hypothetical protein